LGGRRQSTAGFPGKFEEVFKQNPLPGTDVMIFKIFFNNFFVKKLAFLTQNKAKF
jgi:hypothetical protein